MPCVFDCGLRIASTLYFNSTPIERSALGLITLSLTKSHTELRIDCGNRVFNAHISKVKGAVLHFKEISLTFSGDRALSILA